MGILEADGRFRPKARSERVVPRLGMRGAIAVTWWDAAQPAEIMRLISPDVCWKRLRMEDGNAVVVLRWRDGVD